MLAAGYDVPSVQAQVGHEDPTTTLRIYASVIRQPNRDRLRKKMTELLQSGIDGRPWNRRDQAKLF
jgi:integrase